MQSCNLSVPECQLVSDWYFRPAGYTVELIGLTRAERRHLGESLVPLGHVIALKAFLSPSVVLTQARGDNSDRLNVIRKNCCSVLVGNVKLYLQIKEVLSSGALTSSRYAGLLNLVTVSSLLS